MNKIPVCFLLSFVLCVSAQPPPPTGGDQLDFADGLNGIVLGGTNTVIDALPYCLPLTSKSKIAENITVSFYMHNSDAGFSSAFGSVWVNDQNQPVGGEFIFANVKQATNATRVYERAQWQSLGATKFTTFILGDSARKNPWVKDGDNVTFELEDDGSYEVFVDGRKLKHADQGAVFGWNILNPGGFVNMTDIPYDGKFYIGSCDFEDRHVLSGKSDADYNDVSLSMIITCKDSENNIYKNNEWANTLRGSLLQRANDGKSWGQAISKSLSVGDSSVCYDGANAGGSLVAFQSFEREASPDNIQKDPEALWGVYISSDLQTLNVVESSAVRHTVDISGEDNLRVCIVRENGRFYYFLNDQIIYSSGFAAEPEEQLFVSVLLTASESYIADLEGVNFVDGELAIDSDRDGLPDAWEIQYGLDPNNPADASEDVDGDGLLNYQEHADGSSPLVANYAEMPDGFLWWMQGTRLKQNETWIDLSLRGHNAEETSHIERVDENGRSYAHLELNDEIRCAAGTEPWLGGSVGDTLGFTLMVACKPLHNDVGYENMIDLQSGSGDTGGFRLGIQNGSWVVDSPGNNGAYLDDNENLVKIDRDQIIVVRYSADGLLEIWVDGIRRTWQAQTLIKNITGEGYIHKLAEIQTSASFPNIGRKATKTSKVWKLVKELLVSTVYAQDPPESLALIEEIILYGETLSYAETLALAATLKSSPDSGLLTTERLLEIAELNCGAGRNVHSDEDGLSDAYERIIGTNPNDELEDFSLMIERSGATADLSWYGVNGRKYDLEKATDLIAEDWATYEAFTGLGGTLTKTVTMSGIEFWRVVYAGGATDTDNDGIPDWAEACLGTSSSDKDSDGDGFPDGVEVANNENPAVSNQYEITSVLICDPESAGWSDFQSNVVILASDDFRVKVTVSPEAPSLDYLLSNPKFSSLGLRVTGNGTISLTAANAVLYNNGSESEMRITITYGNIVGLGLLPEEENTTSFARTLSTGSGDSIPEKAAYDTGSANSADNSNLTDSQEFMDALSFEDTQVVISRQRASIADELMPNKRFFQAAGYEEVVAFVDVVESAPRYIKNQADFFYVSSHGNSSDGSIGNTFPSDVVGHWNADIDVAIFAGCAVLDINDYNNNYSGNPSPGELWEAVGPEIMVGYNYTAPLDSQNADDIVRRYIFRRESDGDIEAWHQANRAESQWNACAIVKGSAYYYFKERFGIFHDWKNIQKSSW